ncbi:unnamed protein product [Bemisia tabaci]|uniref:Uncharacterized protein n=1 Tax=Bemisia tabaci TaxID=7038 RepID=A0A9P0CCQ8_BEMTA|nr:unnamed protein product [Bemisia tabaci]
MGNVCSSRRADKDNDSLVSESSAQYHVAEKEGVGDESRPAEKSSTTIEHHPPPPRPQKTQPAPPPASASDVTTAGGVGTGVAEKPPRPESRMPPGLAGLSEKLQRLLLGATELTKTSYRSRKIVVYICAADSQDCCAEKGALHNEVLPGLRALCKGHGYELHVVDLHWRTALEKQQDHEFPELCLGELARQSELAYIIPVLFLSNSLGTPLLPKTIEEQDFEIALSKAENNELLKKWYVKDEHAQPPCYRLQPVSSHIPGFQTEGTAEKEEALSAWSSEIERILSVMIAAFSQEQRDSYLTTVIEQEVHNTVVMSRELAKRCIWINRIYTHLPDESKPEQAGLASSEKELKRRLDNLQRDLKNQLDEKHIIKLTVKWLSGGLNAGNPEHAQYLSSVKEKLDKYLNSIVESIIQEDQAKSVFTSQFGIDKSLFNELMIQTYYSQQMAKCSFDREDILSKIQSYLTSKNDSKPLVVHGQRGCGKTTVLARTVKSCQTWLVDCAIVVRYANISPQSSSLPQLLSSVIQHISALNKGQQIVAKHNLETYKQILPTLLASNVPDRNLVIIIDGLDQVKFSNCDWLPETLPSNVKLIFSVCDQSSLYDQLVKLDDRITFLKVPELCQNEAKSILLSSVMEYSHNMDKKLKESLKPTIKEYTLPLYVKVLAWQVSWWNDITSVGDPAKQLNFFLDQLETMFGKEKIEITFALLSNSNFGLTDSEILDLISREKVFHSPATYLVWAPACLFWAALNKRINPFLNWFLTERDSAVRWQDETIKQLISERYKYKKVWALETLRKYFKEEFWNKTNDAKLSARFLSQPLQYSHCYNQRKLDELPTLELKLNNSIKIQYLENLSWVYSKICGSSVLNVLDDIYLEESIIKSDANVSWLQNFLETCSTALNYDGRQFYAQANVYISQHSDSTCPFQQTLKTATENPPVLSLVPNALSEENISEKEKTDSVYFNDVQRLPEGDTYVVTISTANEEIAVWNIKTCEKVRTLRGIPQPITLQMIDNYRCVVLCKRELRTYDLNTGTLLTKLKGVMNQKMPYYGLHDANHLVSLSRNRMYVNLMNIDSGDLVTSFKAGEDRFLNSLLVCGDGRVLVCGDETQKPFPLLVWNLASRKLLYDLRIPHHDFITSLAAITYEGHYVCCVAKEVDEPGPNFIVVYDLQSGTLFKKWKPGVNCVSLDISSKDGCVLSGHEDGRILVWDLITGNCRWTLKGHSAPVTLLRLDSRGGAFLSSDSEGRDMSIRLWNLNNGELTAVFTPSNRITASEVLPGGSCIVLGTEGSSNLTVLRLVGPNAPSQTKPDQPEEYGLPENANKVFDLTEER